MAFEFKGLVTCSLLFIFVLMGQNSLCSVEEELVEISQNNNLTKNTLGENCWEGKCSDRQFCNEIFKCECRPGFINRGNVCVPCAGENEECLTSNDCCGMLHCINGICRKAAPNAEFITLAKICLGITITSIIIALLSSLLKCLMRFDSLNRLRRCTSSNGTNSVNIHGRHILASQPSQSEIQEEKPPSYEECMQRGRRNSLADPPPPYVISSNDLATSKQNHIFSVQNIRVITPPNNVTVPLSIQTLSQERNSEGSFAQKTMTTQSS